MEKMDEWKMNKNNSVLVNPIKQNLMMYLYSKYEVSS